MNHKQPFPQMSLLFPLSQCSTCTNASQTSETGAEQLLLVGGPQHSPTAASGIASLVWTKLRAFCFICHLQSCTVLFQDKESLQYTALWHRTTPAASENLLNLTKSALLQHIELCTCPTDLENKIARHLCFTVPVSGNLQFGDLQKAKDWTEDSVAFAVQQTQWRKSHCALQSVGNATQLLSPWTENRTKMQGYRKELPYNLS